MRTEENYSLLEHNTFGIDARCRRFVEYDTPEELAQLVGQAPLLHIGGGSNLLFLSDYDGTILHSRIRTIEKLPTSNTQADEVLLRVGAGVVWDELVAHTIDNHWYGLENLSLIPGEVGASAVQNIGAYGAEAKDFIVNVECMNLQNGERRTFSCHECQYSYRHSIFKTDAQRGRCCTSHIALAHISLRASTTAAYVPNCNVATSPSSILRQNNCDKSSSTSVVQSCPTQRFKAMQEVSS